MIIYSQTQNVYEATKERIHKVFDTGRPVVVSFSGGKDSTVLLEVTLEVAKERGIPKVPVLFVDQEAEFTKTIEYMRYIMYRPEVEPYWIQCPFRLWNASAGEWFIPWEPGKEWIYEKDAISYKDNVYGVDRFKSLGGAVAKYHFGKDVIQLLGLRIEESPVRRMALLYSNGQVKRSKSANYYSEGYQSYPIFDWSYRDIWYYIFSNKVKYNKVYNLLIAQQPLKSCRVSSVIHENSLGSILTLQEVDPELYNKLYRRVKNIGTTNHTLNEIFVRNYGYPSCFNSWEEYLGYLIDNIIQEKHQEKYRNHLSVLITKTKGWSDADKGHLFRAFFWSIIDEDFEFSKTANMLLNLGRKYRIKENEN